jgi:hypothetical protein
LVILIKTILKKIGQVWSYGIVHIQNIKYLPQNLYRINLGLFFIDFLGWMKMKFKLIAIAIALISFTGCITYKAVGKFENYDEVFIGNVNHRILLGGGGTFDITAVNSGVSCSGTAYKPDKILFNFDCSGQEVNGDGVCTDGKTIKMRWYASSKY